LLRVGEAVITGEAARLPIRCRITLPEEEDRPDSEDPEVSQNWLKSRLAENYDRIVASWRSQNPRWASIRPHRVPLTEEKQKMERQLVESAAVVSVGYEEAAQTLEIEFKHGVYQYYNVPLIAYQQMMAAESIGKYVSAYIKPAYPFARM
jgi:hypothetical protein